MPSFTERLTAGWARAGEMTALAAVPFVLSLTNVDALTAIVAHDGFHIGFKATLPISVVTVWAFVDPPTTGVSVTSGLPATAPYALVAIPAVALVHAVLSAGYFGSMGAAVVGRERSFADCVRSHLRPFLVLVFLPYLLFVPLAGGALGLGAIDGALVALLFLVFPVLVVLGYLFYAAPYLVALRDTDAVTALRASYDLAVEGGPYFRYALGFAGFVLLLSPVMSLVVVNVPGVGLLAGIAAGSYLGLVANVTTMRFVADIDPATTPAREWDADADAAGEV